MMETAHKPRIARWVRALLRPDDSGPDRLVLRHVSINDRTSDVIELPCRRGLGDEDALSALAGELADAVYQDAEGLGGMQRYVLVAYRGERQLARLTLRQAGTALELPAVEPIDSEPANQKGLMSQLMRHLEAQSRMWQASMGEIVSSMQETIERQKSSVDRADSMRLESMTVMEQLLSEQHQRELDLRKAEDERRWRKGLVSQLSLMVPYVINKVAGDKVVPEPVTPKNLMVDGLLDSLTEEQFDALSTVLSREQMATLVEIVLTRKRAEQPAEPEQPAGKGKPS